MADGLCSKSALDKANHEKSDDSNLQMQKNARSNSRILHELRLSSQEHTNVSTRLAALESKLIDTTVSSSTVILAPPLDISQPHQDLTPAYNHQMLTPAPHNQNLTIAHNHHFAKTPFKMEIPRSIRMDIQD